MKWNVSLLKQTAASVEVLLQFRELNSVWMTKEVIAVHTRGGPFVYEYIRPILVRPKTDIRVRVQETFASNIGIAAGFEIDLVKQGVSK